MIVILEYSSSALSFHTKGQNGDIKHLVSWSFPKGLPLYFKIKLKSTGGMQNDAAYDQQPRYPRKTMRIKILIISVVCLVSISPP